MNRFMLFAKTIQQYTLWLTIELPLWKIWLFTLIIAALSAGTGHVLPVSWKQQPWRGLMITLAALNGITLAATLFITFGRGINAINKRLPWLLPGVALSLIVIIPTFMIIENGFARAWNDLLDDVLRPTAYIMVGVIVFTIPVYGIMFMIRRHKRKV